MNFIGAVAYHFCLALPAAFTQPGSRLLAEHSSICSVDASYGTFGGGETETEEAPRKCSRVSAGMAFESDERASALASCRRAVEENAESITGTLGRYVWSLNQQVQVHQDIYFDDNRYRAQTYLAQALNTIMS